GEGWGIAVVGAALGAMSMYVMTYFGLGMGNFTALCFLAAFAGLFVVFLIKYAIECGSLKKRILVVLTFGISFHVTYGITSAVRRAVSRAIVGNNLRQIGLAMLNYDDGVLPATDWWPNEPFGLRRDWPGLSWRVAILPHIEE